MQETRRKKLAYLAVLSGLALWDGLSASAGPVAADLEPAGRRGKAPAREPEYLQSWSHCQALEDGCVLHLSLWSRGVEQQALISCLAQSLQEVSSRCLKLRLQEASTVKASSCHPGRREGSMRSMCWPLFMLPGRSWPP